MKIPTLLFASLAIAALAFVHGDADACGPSAEDLVTHVVDNHFAALAAKDRTLLLSFWTKDATVTTLVKPVRVDSIEAASTRWVASKKPITGAIDSLAVNGKSATVRAHVEYEGIKYDDTLLLVSEDKRTWKIAQKTSRPADAKSVY